MASSPSTSVEPQTAGRSPRGRPIDRIVLEHDQRVEQLAQTGQRLDLRQPEMLVRHQARLALLHLVEKLAQRFRRRQPDPQRQRVDEQADHALDAGDLRRPARDRHAEHHVVAAGQPPEQDRPAAWMKVLSVRPCARACRVSAAVSGSLSDSVICSGATGSARDRAGASRVGLLQPGQGFPPGRHARRRGPARRSRPDSRDRASPAAAPRRYPCAHRAPAAPAPAPASTSRPSRYDDWSAPAGARRPRAGSARSAAAAARQGRSVRAILREEAGQPLPARLVSSSDDRSSCRQGASARGTMICTGRLRSSWRKTARRLAWRASSACAAACSAALSSAPSSASTICTV